MKNTLENEMFDAAVSWCCSNGINVLEPEQLASLVNSLYITVRDAAPANLVLVPLRPTRAMEEVFQQDDWQWSDVLAAAESVTEEQYLFALEDDEQAQPERAPLSDAEIKELLPYSWPWGIEFARAIEAAHGIKYDSAQQAQPERAPSTKGSDQVWFAQRHGIKQGGQHG